MGRRGVCITAFLYLTSSMETDEVEDKAAPESWSQMAPEQMQMYLQYYQQMQAQQQASWYQDPYACMAQQQTIQMNTVYYMYSQYLQQYQAYLDWFQK